MPLSVKKQLFVEEKRQQNAKRRKADSSSSSSTNRSNSQISRQFGYSESFITGQQITSTQKHHSEPISGSKFSTLGSLEKSLSIRNLSGSSNNHITSQQSRPSSLNSIEIPLTNQPNTESNSEPVVVQLSDLAGVSTTRGHMRIRRATSEITDSSGFIPIFNDDIVSGNSSSYSQTSSRGREHSNVAAPSRISE